MPTHQATFINNKPKYGYHPNESRTIQVVRTVQGKLKVTSLEEDPDIEPIVNDKDEDFYKDWRIDSTSGIDA